MTRGGVEAHRRAHYVAIPPHLLHILISIPFLCYASFLVPSSSLTSSFPFAAANKLKYNVHAMPHELVKGTRNRSGTKRKLTSWIKGQTCQFARRAGRYICAGG